MSLVREHLRLWRKAADERRLRHSTEQDNERLRESLAFAHNRIKVLSEQVRQNNALRSAAVQLGMTQEEVVETLHEWRLAGCPKMSDLENI